MPDPAIAITFTGNDADAARMFARQQKEIDGLKASLRGVKAAGEEAKSGLQIGSGIIGEVAGLAAGYLSVGKALEWAGTAAETWRAILRETTAATRETVEASLSYAAMQTGKGTNVKAPAQAVMRMGQEFGFKEQGPVMVLAGGLQAAMGGDVKGAQRETLEMLKLHHVTNQPLEELLDVGKLAAGRGMDPGQFAREVAAAAKETNIDPSIVARGVKSMGAFTGPNAVEEWIATQAVMAKQLGPRGATAVGELPGLFMEGAPKEFTAWAKKQGVGKDTPFIEALGALHERGLTTVEGYKGSGLSLAQKEALSLAVQKQPEIVSLRERLPALGTEAELQKRHEQIAGQYPETEEAEFAAKMEARHAYRVVFDSEAAERRIEDRQLQIRGEAFETTGNRTIFGIDQLDPTGREKSWWYPHVALSRLAAYTFAPERMEAVDRGVEKIRIEQGEGAGVEEGFTWKDVREYWGNVVKQMDGAARKLDSAGDKQFDAASKLRGGAAMVPAGEDR
jgi:hypothetical protein